MRLSSNKLFPYPVLWFVNDDYIDTEFNIAIDIEHEKDELLVNFKVDLANKELLELISAGKASYSIHIENSLTSFRKCHFTSEKSGVIRLEQDQINHKIEISTLIIAREDIFSYTNKSLNKDYEGFKFDIKKGSVIAIGDQISVIIDKDINDKGDRDSIFSFIKLQEEGPMEYEIEGDRILIKLGNSDFENLEFLQSSKYEKIIHSIFIYPALIFVFETLKRGEVGEYSDNLWFRSLEKILNSQGLDLDSQTIEKETSFRLSQRLLDMPISGALDSLLVEVDEDED
ncbi:MAG: hypothetical protein GX219_10210 [Tissierellia bacterium]|nr:hypothetical protein [Tissierellia bacterium]